MTTRRAVTLNVQSSQRIIDFGKAGNKAIFDDVFPKLKRVFERGLHGKKIVGTEATDWDAETLHNEQFTVVQPIYLTYAGSDKDMQDELKALASGSDIFWLGGVAIGHSLDFTGDIMSPTDRYNHGSQKVAAFYKKFKQAIESARTNRQVSRPDPSAGGMVRAG